MFEETLHDDDILDLLPNARAEAPASAAPARSASGDLGPFRWLWLLIAIAVTLFVLWARAAYSAQLPQSSELTDIDTGSAITLADAAGGKPLLLIFSTQSCPYCREELTALDGMRDQLPESSVRMLAVFPGMPLDTARGVIRSRWGVKNIRACVDDEGQLFEAAGVSAVPMSLLIGADGRTIESWVGYPGANAIKDAVSALL